MPYAQAFNHGPRNSDVLFQTQSMVVVNMHNYLTNGVCPVHFTDGWLNRWKNVLRNLSERCYYSFFKGKWYYVTLYFSLYDFQTFFGAYK